MLSIREKENYRKKFRRSNNNALQGKEDVKVSKDKFIQGHSKIERRENNKTKIWRSLALKTNRLKNKEVQKIVVIINLDLRRAPNRRKLTRKDVRSNVNKENLN